LWRKVGANWNIIAEVNIFAKLTAATINTVTLATPFAALEGDVIGVKIVTSGVAGYQFFLPSSQTLGHKWKYTDTGAGDASGFNWDGAAANANTVPFEVYMTAPQTVFIGDSIMAGHPAHFAFTEVTDTTVLANQIAWQFNLLKPTTYQNMGIGSETTSNVLTRFTTDVLALNPRILVMNGGVNDIALNATYTTFYNNWQNVLERCRKANIFVIACAIAPWTAGTTVQMQTRDLWNAGLQALCAKFSNVLYVNLDTALGQFRAGGDAGNLWDIIPAYNADNVHFNLAGYTAYAAAIYALINSYLEIKEDVLVDGKVTTDAVQFDIAATPLANAEGLLQWNATDGTLDLGMSGGDITMQIGQEIFTKVRNDTGATITNGSVVYISGRTGIYPDVKLARSDVESTSRVLGIATQDILNTGSKFGYVTTIGYIRRIKTDYSGAGIWGTTWVTGDLLYVSKTTAGQLTNVEPAAPHHADTVGTVGIVHPTLGSILITLDRHKTLEELTDVDGTPLTTSGQFPVWNQTAGYFDFGMNIYDVVSFNDEPIFLNDEIVYNSLLL
jgi:lysophospholipase L1-like esterase